MSKSQRTIEEKALVRRLKAEGLTAWRPIGTSRVRLIELLMRALNRIRPEDPAAALNAIDCEARRARYARRR